MNTARAPKPMSTFFSPYRHEFVRVGVCVPQVAVAERDARVYQQVPASACRPPYADATSCNPHYLGQPAPAVNAGTYDAASHLLSVALLYQLGR